MIHVLISALYKLFFFVSLLDFLLPFIPSLLMLRFLLIYLFTSGLIYLLLSE